MSRLKLFIGSVQKEPAAERRAIRSFVDSDPLLRRFFERDHRVCEGLFLVRYIEKFGTGTLMMIRECRAPALPEPDFVQRSGEFVTTVWRDWFTEQVLNELRPNERQQSAIVHVKTYGEISNPDYRRLNGVSKPTASRELGGVAQTRCTNQSRQHRQGHLLRPEEQGSHIGLNGLIQANGLTMGSNGSCLDRTPTK